MLGLDLGTQGLLVQDQSGHYMYGAWTDGWKGVGSPPQGALVQGIKPLHCLMAFKGVAFSLCHLSI